VQLLPGWCETALEFMDQTPDVAMGIIYFKDCPNGDWKPKFEYQQLHRVPYANFGIVRRDIGDELGWFDESLGVTYGADTAFAFELLVRGYGIAPIWDCKVLHYREIDADRTEHYRTIGSDRAAFDAKWRDRADEVLEAWEKWRHLSRPVFCE